ALQQHAGTTAVEMCSGAMLCLTTPYHFGQIKHLIARNLVKNRMQFSILCRCRQYLQAIEKGRALFGTRAVVQGPRTSELIQVLRHAEDRRDADAAGD